jgi:MYXO-CTERM domain-containing protein
MAGADRRFQAAFWDATTGDGYLSYMKAGSTGTFNSAFLETAALPATGILNTGGSNLATTGATTHSFGTNTTAVHSVTYRITSTASGVDLAFSATDDSGTLRTFTASDTSSAYLSFDRFDLTFWGNTVNFNIDNVAVVTSVPEPAAVFLGSLGLLGLLRRRR